MRFLFVSRRGASLSLATRIVSEGHKVNFFVNNLLYKVLGKGIIDKAKIGEFHNCDVIIFDESGMGEYASKMAKSKPVIGSSVFADLFNDNIYYKQKVLAKCGLQLGSEIKSEVRSEEIDEGHQKGHQKGHDKCKEIYITGFYNGFSFISPFYSYFKKTKFMENDLSIETECAGCLLFYHKANKIVKETLHKLRNELKKIGYRGAITFECSITEKELFINNVHFGFTYDNFYAALEGLRQPLGEFLYGMAIGGIKRVKVSQDWLSAVRVTIPPYPFQMSDKFNEPITIGGICSDNLRHIYLRDIQLVNNSYTSANCDGYLMTITARALTPYKSFKRCYRTIGNLQIKDVQFRRDILIGMEEKYRKLKSWGWFN